MKISYNWLKRFIDIQNLEVEEIGKKLTSSGLEVEHIEAYESVKGSLQGIVIAEVKTCVPHPNADKLRLTTVDIGNEIVPIVCGAANVAAGQKVVVATVGAELYPVGGEAFKIKKAKIRGEESQGMICAEDEIGLGTSHDGIMVLDTDLPNGTPAADFFKISKDFVFEIGLTPNRIDAASHYGTARDLSAVLELDLKKPDVSAFKPDSQSRQISVQVENSTACPRYTGLTISNLTVKESPEWLKNFLKAIGLNPINNIVDITNFVLHGLGQPLHAFDADKIAGNKIIVKNLAEGTPFTTLDGVARKLKANDLMICDGNQTPLCIGGVFGGKESGISADTTSIFLESAYFSPISVRKTGQQHALKTDSSFRFERGTDPNMPVFALKYAALLIKEVAGGEVSSDITDIYPEAIPNFEFEVKWEYLMRLMGQEIPKETVLKILEKLEIGVSKNTENSFWAAVPPYRVDAQQTADIAEEVLRIYGYDNIRLDEHLSSSFLAHFPKIDDNKIRYQVGELLVGNGFCEILTNSLTKATYWENSGQFDNSQNVDILNKLSNDLGVMRQSLIFSGLEVVSTNINRKQSDLRLFEFGKTYHKIGNSYQENDYLVLFLTGNKNAETWQNKSQKVSFYELNQFIQKVFTKLGIGEVQTQEASAEVLQYGLSWNYKKEEIAWGGLLKKSVLKELDIKQDVFYAQIRWDWVLKNIDKSLKYAEIAKFPAVRRDLSLVLDKNVSFEQIRKMAFQAERNLLEQINVFDVYEGNNLGEGKKAYSVSFILQDYTQTLTDKIIDKTMSKLMNVFETELGAIIRK